MCSEQMMKEYKLDLVYNKEQILKLADCNGSNPNYETYLGVLDELIEDHENAVVPKGYVILEEKSDYMKEGSLGIVSCMVTIGNEIDELVNKAFEKADYLEGLFLNCFGDSVLFECSNSLYKKLKKDMIGEGLFMSARQEPGDMVNDMELQKDIFDNIKSNFDTDVTITEGYMLNPAKSMLYFYNLSDKDTSRGIDHSCEQCGNLSCVNRMVKGEKLRCDFVEV